MSLHFKIKRYALVCRGQCGRTKANQFKTLTKWRKPGHGCEKEWLLPLHFKGMTRSNLNDRISIYFNSRLIAPRFCLWALKISLQLKTKAKTWPHEDCYQESVFATQEGTTFALKNQRIAFCWWAKGLTLCHDLDYENMGQEAGLEPHNSLLSKQQSRTPRKTNTSGIKTLREGGFE